MVDFIEELQRYTDAEIKGNDAWIRCPFHGGGHERTPSCRINLIKGKYPAGFFYCYGCGKHGLWNDLAQVISGLTPLSDSEIKHQELIITKLTPQQRNSLLGYDENEMVDFSSMIDWNKNKIWRKINGNLLNEIGAKKFYNKSFNTNQIFLPCYQNGKLNGGIKGVLERLPGQHGYFNTAGPWVKKTLFPYDFTKKFMKSHGNIVALVEGPRDALNLLQGGYPALAILGSKNWSNVKRDLILMLDPDLIVLAFDNDEAGQSAFVTVQESFKDVTNMIKLDFKEGQDPGDLTLDEIHKYYKKSLNLVNSL